MQSTAAPGRKTKSELLLNKRRLRWLLLLGIVCGGVLLFVVRDRLSVDVLVAWVEKAGWLAPLAFALIYAMGTVFMVSGLALTLAGGALFGPFVGTAVNLVGAMLGATVAFLIARYVGAGWVQARIGGRFRQVRDGIERRLVAQPHHQLVRQLPGRPARPVGDGHEGRVQRFELGDGATQRQRRRVGGGNHKLGRRHPERGAYWFDNNGPADTGRLGAGMAANRK